MLGYLPFCALSRDAQSQYVQAHGILLASRLVFGYRVELYHLRTFFCERWSSQSVADQVHFRPFTSTESLLPYLELVQLPLL